MTYFQTCLFLLLVGVIGAAYAETCAGCPSTRDSNDPEIRNILTKSVTLQNAKLNDEDINIIKIDKVSSQVVAGIKYTYDFRGEGQQSKKLYNCHSVILHQPWISPDPQVLEYSCSTKKAKRDVLGGSRDINSEELEQVRRFVETGMETLDELDADDNKRVVSRILDAKKKLVNGIMYYVVVEVKMTSCSEEGEVNKKCLSEEVGPLKLCKLQIYRSFADRSPHSTKVVKSECDTAKVRSLPGEENLKPEYTKRVAEFATKRINNALNSIHLKGLVNVLESNHMYNSGLHHVSLTIELGDTNCTKQGSMKNSGCIVLPNDENHLVCSVEVTHDEKSDKMHLPSNGFNCRNVKHDMTLSNRARRALFFDERPLELSDESASDLKEFISSYLSRVSDSVYKKSIANVFSVTYRITTGRVVTMLAEIADTNCLKDQDNEEVCSFRQQDRLICEISVWERPWLNSREITNKKCNPIKPTAEVLGVDKFNKDLQNFQKFTQTFNKSYPTVKELKRRFRIFRANMKKADFLQKTEQGSATYGASIFADLTSSEFKKNYLGLNKHSSSEPRFPMKQADIPEITLPEEYDWRNYNVVTPVKNQGLCGSCWAFSITGNIEGQYAIKTGNLVSLSEQELVDCDKYDSGCEGGLFDSAFHAVEDLGGLESESDYPYTGRDGKCRFDSTEVRVSISSSVNISHNETDMAKWLVGNGPISIGLNANAMQFYLGGVSHPLKFLCSPDELDHGVLIVGYGIHQTWLLHRHLPYWLIKNSWGPHWGQQGYYMLYRGDGSCGVNQWPSSAVL